VFENLRRCLAAAGLSFDEVIKLTYYLTDMAHLPTVRTVRDEFIDTARPPASTAVQVVALTRNAPAARALRLELGDDGKMIRRPDAVHRSSARQLS
jgi:enamine deaminase RidA (YjgF/YER057c/UK114 family)